jgi:hypothetical protein
MNSFCGIHFAPFGEPKVGSPTRRLHLRVSEASSGATSGTKSNADANLPRFVVSLLATD